MMSATKRSFWNSGCMRLIALGIAAACALWATFLWQDAQEEKAQMPAPASALESYETTDAVESCIATRTAEIEKLVADGLMSRESADLSINRARSLCIEWQAPAPVN